MMPEAWLTGRRGQASRLARLAWHWPWSGSALIDPVWSWFADRAMLLEQRQALLHRMQDVAATLPSLRAASAAKRGEGEGRLTMLPGATDALAAADLQERVQKMASTAGASLTAVETLPAAPAGKWHKVSLRISLNAPVAGADGSAALDRAVARTHPDRRCALPQRHRRHPSDRSADPGLHGALRLQAG